MNDKVTASCHSVQHHLQTNKQRALHFIYICIYIIPVWSDHFHYWFDFLFAWWRSEDHSEVSHISTFIFFHYVSSSMASNSKYISFFQHFLSFTSVKFIGNSIVISLSLSLHIYIIYIYNRVSQKFCNILVTCYFAVCILCGQSSLSNSKYLLWLVVILVVGVLTRCALLYCVWFVILM